jgi:beta-xylosidase
MALLVLALAGAGCGNDDAGAGATSGSPAGSGDAPSASGPAGGGSSPATSSASPSSDSTGSPDAGTGTFTNPVIDANFADPFILEVDGTWYAYATGNLTYNMQVTSSSDLVTWASPREALPKLPLWQPVSKGLTWAPEVVRTDAGYVMHYTSRDVQAGKQCLSVAVADGPEGPFVDTSDEPLVCQLELGGSIDSSPFRDEDDSLWLVWKNDGNCCGMRTRFFLASLDETGTELTGPPIDLGLDNNQAWEGNVIEAPQIVRHDDTYYLFYSANDYGSPAYAVGYATSDKLEGPYTDADENPILVSAGNAAGPGHQSLFTDGSGEPWMAYHAWDAALVGDSAGGRRGLWLDRVSFEDGKPVVHGPTSDAQPVP